MSSLKGLLPDESDLIVQYLKRSTFKCLLAESLKRYYGLTQETIFCLFKPYLLKYRYLKDSSLIGTVKL
jgi:hypothetical protein